MKKKVLMYISVYLIGMCFFIIPMLIQSEETNIALIATMCRIVLVGMIPFLLIIILFVFITRDKVRVGADKKKLEKYMKNVQMPIEFSETYDRVHQEYNVELEQKRKKIRMRKVIEYIFEVAAFFTYILLRTNSPILSAEVGTNAFIIFIIGLIGTIIMVCINYNCSRSYESLYKDKIINTFIKLYNPKLEYVGDPEFDVRQYYNIPDFDRGESYNRFFYDDYIRGEISEGVEADIIDLTVRYHSSGKNSYTKTLFEGLMISTSINQRIEKPVKILHNELFYVLKSKPNIRLDSVKFEKLFDVFAENEIFATRLLTADIMEMLVDFYNKFGIHFEIVALEKKLYLRFFTGDMFEPQIFGKSLDKEQLFQYYSILEFVIEVTKMINHELDEIEQ